MFPFRSFGNSKTVPASTVSGVSVQPCQVLRLGAVPKVERQVRGVPCMIQIALPADSSCQRFGFPPGASAIPGSASILRSSGPLRKSTACPASIASGVPVWPCQLSPLGVVPQAGRPGCAVQVHIALPSDALLQRFGFSRAASAIPPAFSTPRRVLSGSAFQGSASSRPHSRLVRFSSSPAPAANNRFKRTCCARRLS